MGQSLVQNYMHVVFSTKNLTPLLFPEYEESIYDYLGGICRNIESPSLIVGGHLDHIHILSRISKNISLSEFAKKVKSNSSRWVKTKDVRLENFSWQDGYGAFSVSPSHVPNLIDYIANQHQHHKKEDFKEEYITLLKKYDLDYKEEYLW